MKLLFLDMDGVLNSHQSSHYFWWSKHGRKGFGITFDELCPIACSNLNNLLEEFQDMKIVISSTWRLFNKLEEWDLKMKDICPAIVGRVIGQTPSLTGRPPRGHEIHAWLEENNHLNTPFIVLDDDSDMDKVTESFIWVDGRVGFSWINLEKAKMMLRLKEPKE